MRHTYISAAVMVALGTGVFFGAELYQPQPAFVPIEIAPDQTPEETEASSETLSVLDEDTEDTESFSPSPTNLNLIHMFPEGADSADQTQSYGGEAFRILMTQDETWMSGIYDYSDYAPIALASRLGRSREQVMGRYNPKDSTHDPNDPNTWTINSFKEIRMQVTDGDGTPISVYSNVIEIMSMANVYTWYHGMDDYDLFLNYAKELWKASHSYSVSMSDVYYCSGCMDEEAEERERERLEAAARAEEQGFITEEGIETEGSSGTADSAESQVLSSPVILSNHSRMSSAESAESDTHAAEETAASPAEAPTSSVITVGQSKQLAAAETSEALETASSSETSEGMKVSEEIQMTEGMEASEEMGLSEENQVSEENIRSGESGNLKEQETSAENSAGEGSGEASSENTEHADSEYAGYTESEDAVEPAGEELATASNANGQASRHQTDCPGHIDLIIQMKICGLDDAKGLYALDSMGNAESNISESGWPGWNDETKGYVKQLSSQDWFQNYGLSVSVISMLNPLTSSEIDSYLEQLPKALSPTRRKIVEFALSSVGKVPYYWGGKASHPDYEGNQFGTLVSPDTKGRVLKGLDCSGWIGWVYWSATGERLPYESTSGLAVCGTRIGREQLQPGDIIVRTGDDAHVIMFLGWTEDGRILCIHESSAGVNNVTVAVRDANWPYYRKLLD